MRLWLPSGVRAVPDVVFILMLCAALAARPTAVPIGSIWTDVLDRSSLDGTARW